MIECPICEKQVKEDNINAHIDSGCEALVEDEASQDAVVTPDGPKPACPNATANNDSAPAVQAPTGSQGGPKSSSQSNGTAPAIKAKPTASIFGGGLGGSKYASQDSSGSSWPRKTFAGQSKLTSAGISNTNGTGSSGRSRDEPQAQQRLQLGSTDAAQNLPQSKTLKRPSSGQVEPLESAKRQHIEGQEPSSTGKRAREDDDEGSREAQTDAPPANKRVKTSTSTNLQKAAPLAERMRPRTMDEVFGQALVDKNGALRVLVEQDRVPSIILWGGPGTGKTTIARIIASQSGGRFVEINSTSTGVAECKKLFAEARSELGLTGRKTIIFCDEIHRFSKSQQDVFLGPVEAGQIILIGATTENPSFKVINALLSRCRVFTLASLTEADILYILQRALKSMDTAIPARVDEAFLGYISAFASGDARTALNLLEISISICLADPTITDTQLKQSLTQTLVYDRVGDSHYDTISALHKSLRGSDPDASLYYLARMVHSGEDPLFIARRLVVVASEDIGLADNSMLSLATATYAAVEKIGMPEARIALAHCVVALALAPKSTRAYRGLANAIKAIEREPEVAGLKVPMHLRNAPTRLLKEMGAGKEYKYNPSYLDGKVKQVYLPELLIGRRFLEDLDLGTEMDPDLEADAQASGGGSET